MLSSFSTHKKVMSCFNWITSKVKSSKPMMLLKMQSNKTIKSGECMWHMSPIQSWNNFTISSSFLKIFSIERKSISHIFIYFDSIRFKCNYIIDYLWRTYIQQNRPSYMITNSHDYKYKIINVLLQKILQPSGLLRLMTS